MVNTISHDSNRNQGSKCSGHPQFSESYNLKARLQRMLDVFPSNCLNFRHMRGLRILKMINNYKMPRDWASGQKLTLDVCQPIEGNGGPNKHRTIQNNYDQLCKQEQSELSKPIKFSVGPQASGNNMCVLASGCQQTPRVLSSSFHSPLTEST